MCIAPPPGAAAVALLWPDCCRAAAQHVAVRLALRALPPRAPAAGRSRRALLERAATRDAPSTRAPRRVGERVIAHVREARVDVRASERTPSPVR